VLVKRETNKTMVTVKGRHVSMHILPEWGTAVSLC